MTYDVDAPGGVDLDRHVDMEWDGDDEELEDEDEEDEEKEIKDEDHGKELQTIGQGEMVNSSGDDIDTMVHDQRIVLPEQGQKMQDHTTQPPPPVPAPWPGTRQLRPRPQIPETYPVSGLEHLRLVTTQKPRPAVATLRDAESAGNTSDVHMDQQLLIESTGDASPTNQVYV
jgi:hypothetical protein